MDTRHEASSSASTISSMANATALRPTSSDSNGLHIDEAFQRLNSLMDTTADGFRELCSSFVTQMKDIMLEARRQGDQLREQKARVVEQRKEAEKSVEELNARMTKMENELRDTKANLEQTREEGRSMKLQLDTLMKEREERSLASLRITAIHGEERSAAATTARTSSSSAASSSKHLPALSAPSAQARPARPPPRRSDPLIQPQQSESSSQHTSGSAQSTSTNPATRSLYIQHPNPNLSEEDIEHGFSIAQRILESQRQAADSTPEMQAFYDRFLRNLSEHDKLCASTVLVHGHVVARHHKDNVTVSQGRASQAPAQPSHPVIDSRKNPPKRKRVNEATQKDAPSQPVRSPPRPQSTNVQTGSQRKRIKIESDSSDGFERLS